MLRELRALRRETAERALFEPDARACVRRKTVSKKLEHVTAAEEKEVRDASRAEEEPIGAERRRATRATTRRARKKYF